MIKKTVVELILRNPVGAMARLQVVVEKQDTFEHQHIFQSIAFGEFEILPTEASMFHLDTLITPTNNVSKLKFYLNGAVFEEIPFTRHDSLVPYICTIDILETIEQVHILNELALKHV